MWLKLLLLSLTKTWIKWNKTSNKLLDPKNLSFLILKLGVVRRASLGLLQEGKGIGVKHLAESLAQCPDINNCVTVSAYSFLI